MQDITPDDAKNADQPTLNKDGLLTDEHEGLPSSMRTLWYAIRETRYGAMPGRTSGKVVGRGCAGRVEGGAGLAGSQRGRARL
jgi:hypothetical protein